MRYLLDTNAVISILNGTSASVMRRLRHQSPEDVAISVVVTHELHYGAFKSRRSVQNVGLIDALRFTVLELDKEDARKAGEIRALLASKGIQIGPYDVLIAGQALARDLVLVSNNLAEFRRVPGLQLEDWQADV